MIGVIILAFITGLVVKLTDVMVDDKKKILFNGFENVLGIFYGILIGAMVSRFSIVAPLWIGVIIGLVVMGKFDSMAHLIAFPFIALTIYLLGTVEIDIVLIFLFAVACVVDEIMSDYADKAKKKKKIHKFLQLRPFVEIAALIVSIIMMRFEFIVAIFSFDVGYVLVTKMYKKKK